MACAPRRASQSIYFGRFIFLKVYPRDAPGCSTVGGSKGAINPKTLRKWVWFFIERIAELADDVVSIFLSCRGLHPRTLPHLPITVPIVAIQQIDFESRLLGVHNVGNDCLMTIDGTDYRILQKGAARKGNAFGSFKYAGKSPRSATSLGWISSRGIRFGSQDPTPRVSTLTLQFLTAFLQTASSQESALRPTTATSGARTR